MSLIQSVQIPLFFKYGAENGRIYMFISIILIAFIIGGVFYIVEKMSINLQLDNLSNIANYGLSMILLIATIVIYRISYSISYRIYRKKEI